MVSTGFRGKPLYPLGRAVRMGSPLMETVLVVRSRGGDRDQDFARELRYLIVGGGAYYLLQATQSGDNSTCSSVVMYPT